MPDISQSSQATISQALTQLSQLAPTSAVAQQGVEVLVKHLSGNVLSLNKNTVLLNKTVLLANPEYQGKLAEGQIHQVKLSIESNPSLVFFSPTSSKSTSFITLTEQQVLSLFRLPAKQLIPSSLLGHPDTASKLPVLNATVLPALPKELLSTVLTDKQLNRQPDASPFDAKNTKLTKTPNMLRLSLTDQRPPVEVALTVKQLNQFTVGEKVSLLIAPKGNNWQVTIAHNKADATVTAKRLTSTVEEKGATEIKGTTEKGSTKNQLTTLPPLLAAPIIKASLLKANLVKPVNIELAIKPVLQQLSKNNSEQNQDLIQKLQAVSIDKISLQIKPSGEVNLLLHSIKPVAVIPITKQMAQVLAPLKLPSQQALIKQLNLPAETNKQAQSTTQVTRPEINLTTQQSSAEVLPKTSNANDTNKLVSNTAQDNPKQSQDLKLNIKEAAANLLLAVKENPVATSVISQSLLSNKPEQLNLVQSLLRIVQAKAETPAIILQSVEKALQDSEFFNDKTEQPSKQLVAQILQQIKQALPQGNEQDADKIRQLLTSPALNLSAIQMISPTANQGLMSGLITLLQMSLSARLARDQSSRSEHIAGVLNKVLSGTSKIKSRMTPKAMGEMSQLEHKHQLMKEIGRLLSGHQANKISNAEQMIQGQETFYYNLPSAFGGTIKDIELLIKREAEHKENASAEAQDNKTWQLTMKLAVGELGELLTKAKLRSNTLEINFYASNQIVQIQVMNYLPLLRRKLESLGIEVSKSQCQLGKIPDTLQQRPYHVFQAKA
ncbi:MAG: flagellar hook-length control protein FliK [Paraglaciecola sp.]|nr:flagellar hook-length control protein FliK [Paraglaciecola sp.]